MSNEFNGGGPGTAAQSMSIMACQLHVDPEQERRERIRARATAIYAAWESFPGAPESSALRWERAYDIAGAGESADARFFAEGGRK